tara:strand:- start:84 stop:623 length:540 start_codon:yes stop_codon:yes gene_type:complete
MTKKRITEIKKHLDNIDQNEKVSNEYIEKYLLPRVRDRFKSCGYPKSSKNKNFVLEYIDMIFETQDYRCTHWIRSDKGEINGVWNRPGHGWQNSWIIYEVDHILPVSAGGKDRLENFQFISSNANQMTKCSMPYKLFLKRNDISEKAKNRVHSVLKRKCNLYVSEKWKNYIKKLNDYEK